MYDHVMESKERALNNTGLATPARARRRDDEG